MIVSCGKKYYFFLHTQINRLLTNNNVYTHTFIWKKQTLST